MSHFKTETGWKHITTVCFLRDFTLLLEVTWMFMDVSTQDFVFTTILLLPRLKCERCQHINPL